MRKGNAIRQCTYALCLWIFFATPAYAHDGLDGLGLIILGFFSLIATLIAVFTAKLNRKQKILGILLWVPIVAGVMIFLDPILARAAESLKRLDYGLYELFGYLGLAIYVLLVPISIRMMLVSKNKNSAERFAKLNAKNASNLADRS